MAKKLYIPITRSGSSILASIGTQMLQRGGGGGGGCGMLIFYVFVAFIIVVIGRSCGWIPK